MRTTLTLDDDLYERARGIAELSGKRLGEVISQLAREGLAKTSDDAEAATPPTLDHGKEVRINLGALRDALEDLP